MSFKNKYHPAKWWQNTNDKKIKCTLCPRFCILSEGQRGFCHIRLNENNKLVSTGYGHPTGFGIDPIEKKPLHHFLPGTDVLSFGTLGCNLGCKFCQNWSISKAKDTGREVEYIPPEEIVHFVKKKNIPSIAFTYNDPNIFGEFVIDVSKLAKENGIKTVMVTAGYINPEPRNEIYEFIDAANVDLKAFTKSFYKKLVNADINYVLDTIKWIKNNNIWLELTNLLIPNENDSEDEITEMCKWIYSELGPDVPIHFTAFHPSFKLDDRPRTPESTIEKAYAIAKQEGLNFVYAGNIQSPDMQTTLCPNCNTELIKRDWHTILKGTLDKNECPHCNFKIAGVFY